MPNHILLNVATRRRHQNPDMPLSATYDISAGFWMLDGQPLVTTDALGPLTSKKNDLETGEDQKGQ